MPVLPFLKKVPLDSFLSGSCFQIRKWVSFTFVLSASQIGVFVLGPWACKTECGLLRVGFPFPTVLFFLDISPLVFKAWHLGGCLFVQNLRVKVLDTEHKSLTPHGKVLYFSDSVLIVDCQAWDGIFLVRQCLCLSYLY